MFFVNAQEEQLFGVRHEAGHQKMLDAILLKSFGPRFWPRARPHGLQQTKFKPKSSQKNLCFFSLNTKNIKHQLSSTQIPSCSASCPPAHTLHNSRVLLQMGSTAASLKPGTSSDDSLHWPAPPALPVPAAAAAGAAAAQQRQSGCLPPLLLSCSTTGTTHGL